MSNYNSQLQSNNTDLQEVLQALQSKAAAGQAIPVISVSSNGLITATAGTKSATKQLAFQAAKTITPSAASQIAVSSGYYTGGDITVASVPTQTKTVTPTSTTQNVTPDSGKFLSKVTVNGDSDLVAGNIKSGVNIFGVTGTYVGSGGGDTSAEDGLVARTLTSYTNNRVASIGNHAFQSCSSLISASFPVAKNIGDYAFQGCYSLSSINFPEVTTIGIYAFQACSRLISVSFPMATSIGSYAFASQVSLKAVNFPKAIDIGGYAFYYCSKLSSISFPAATEIGPDAFYRCYSLTTINFPNATIAYQYAFDQCNRMTTANFPKLQYIRNSVFAYCSALVSTSFPMVMEVYDGAFEKCSKLTTLSFPCIINISAYAFKSCYNLISLYLTGSSVCKLKYSNAFSSTPIGGYSASAGAYGSIYVPTSLLTSYQTATNWAYFSSRFVGI